MLIIIMIIIIIIKIGPPEAVGREFVYIDFWGVLAPWNSTT